MPTTRSEDPDRASRTSAPAGVRVPVVGRAVELAQLEALVGRASGAHGRVALLSGEAGVGKTRLVEELRWACQGGSAWFLGGSAFPGDAGVAFGPVAESIRGARRRQPAFWEAALARSDVLGAIVPELTREAGHARRGGPADLPVLFEALLDAVEEASADGPCLWVLEDLHWADASTWEFVKHTTRRVDELPLVLVATYREEEVGPVHAWWQRLAAVGSRAGVEAVRLARLADEEIAEMVAILAPGLPASEAREIVRRSAGTPLFVEELVALATPARRALPAVPEIVETTFLTRAEKLPPEARELVDLVAVAGGDATVDLLISLELRAIDAALEACRLGGLLARSDEGAVLFRHPLLLEAAYRQVPPVRRARLHRNAARAIAERRPDSADRVASHLERAGDPGEALATLEAAAQQARRAGNVGRAASLDQAALELARRHPALAAREDTLAKTAIADLFRAGRWTELDPLIRAHWTRRPLLEPGERAWMASVYALHLFWTGSISEAGALADDEIGHLETTGELDAGAMLLAQAAFIAWFRGDAHRALALGGRALQIAQQCGDVEAECRARNALISATFGLERDRESAAQQHLTNARFARAHGLAVGEANALWSASHFVATTEAYEAAERAADRAGTWYSAPARIWAGILRLVEGRPDEAEEAVVQVGSQIRNGVPAMVPWIDTIEALFFLHRGEIEEARRLLQAPALEEAARLAVWGDQRSAAQGWLAWEEGRWRDAAEHLGRAERECARAGYHLTVGGPILLPLHIDALLRLRRRSEAEAVLKAVVDVHAPSDRFFRASLSAAIFRLNPSAPAARHAVEDATAAPWPWLAALVLCWQGELLRDRRALSAARQRFDELGAYARMRQADELLAALGGRARGQRGSSNGLSARELDVAELIAAGLTNPAIGRRLHLSRPTVASHVAHILTKLGFSSRSQIAAWFADQQALGATDRSSI